MKLNHKFVRTVTTTAAVLGAAAMLSVGAFAAEADINDPAAAGYLPPQEQMVQGDIALSAFQPVRPCARLLYRRDDGASGAAQDGA